MVLKSVLKINGLCTVTLNDDPSISVSRKKGGISEIQFYTEDISGPDATWYSTDKIKIPSPVKIIPTDFTVHVHKDNIPVYKSSGTSGKRRESIGSISIGDIVYKVID